MNEPLDNFIEALREELKQYGEMLALLDHQQELLITRQTAGILESVAAINTQADAIQAVRRERDQRRWHLARALRLEENLSLKSIINYLPASYRPLADALIQENQELLVRVQLRARQNHLLLSRAVELMQQFIKSILPGAAPSTYTDSGEVHANRLPEHSLYSAVG
jgi:flagellar biosynthesis/type III secretory pathway chaperone